MKIKFAVLAFFLASAAEGAQVIKWSMSSWANGNMSGGKFKQEDTFSHAMIKGGDWFGVFDGHGGEHDDTRTCDLLRDNLHVHFQNAWWGNEQQRLVKSFEIANEEAMSFVGQSNGSTAVVAYIKYGKVHVAHAGDSRAAFFSGDGKIIFQTADHVLTNESEVQRIRTVYPDEKIFKSRVHMQGDPVIINDKPSGERHASSRIHKLPVTRSVGDSAFKFTSKEYPLGNGAIIAEPDYTSFDIADENQFMIIATDGIWEKMSSQEAIKIVNAAMAESIEDLRAKYAHEPLVVDETTDKKIREAISRILLKNEEGFKTLDPNKEWHEIATEKNISYGAIEKMLGWQEGLLKQTCLADGDISFRPLIKDLVDEQRADNVYSEKLMLAARALRYAAVQRGSRDNIAVCVVQLPYDSSFRASIQKWWYYMSNLKKGLICTASTGILAVVVGAIYSQFKH